MNTKVNPTAREYSIAEARRSLPSLVREAEDGKSVRLTRRGEPVAVLIGHREFERLSSGRRDFVETYEEFLKSYDLLELDIDPDEAFRAVRDKSPGREVSL